MAPTDQLKKEVAHPFVSLLWASEKKKFFVLFRRSICFNVKERIWDKGGSKVFFFIFGTLGAPTYSSFLFFQAFFWRPTSVAFLSAETFFWGGRGFQKSGHLAPLMHLHFPDKKSADRKKISQCNLHSWCSKCKNSICTKTAPFSLEKIVQNKKNLFLSYYPQLFSGGVANLWSRSSKGGQIKIKEKSLTICRFP